MHAISYAIYHKLPPNLLGDDTTFKITVKVDKDNRNIIICDNGIGMNKEELIENLGTILYLVPRTSLINSLVMLKKIIC